jgi:hypothetical protein
MASRTRPGCAVVAQLTALHRIGSSILSIGSIGSVLSVGSVGSFASFGSLGSFAASLSTGSAMAHGSVMSFQSAGSVMSSQSTRACERPSQQRIPTRWGGAAITLAAVALSFALYLMDPPDSTLT